MNKYDTWVHKNPLRRWRITEDGRSLTQYRVAAKLKCSPQIVRLWECGASTPNKRNFPKIARLLGIEESTLRSAWDRWLGKCPV